MNIDLMRERRRELGMTQQELADVCGLSRVTILNYESGKFEPTKENLALLANVLGVLENDLLFKSWKVSFNEIQKMIEETEVSLITYINNLVGCDNESSFAYSVADVLQKIFKAQIIFLPKSGYVAFLKYDGEILKISVDVFKCQLNALISLCKGFRDFDKQSIEMGKLSDLLCKETDYKYVQLNQNSTEKMNLL